MEETPRWLLGTHLDKLVPYWAPILHFYFIVLAVICPVRAYYGKCSWINNTWCLLQFCLYCHVLYCVIPWKLQERFLNNKGIYKK